MTDHKTDRAAFPAPTVDHDNLFVNSLVRIRRISKDDRLAYNAWVAACPLMRALEDARKDTAARLESVKAAGRYRCFAEIVSLEHQLRVLVADILALQGIIEDHADLIDRADCPF